MAEYSKLVITNDGQALMAKMIAGSGNIEFLAYLKWKKPQEAISEERIRQVVEEAHETLKK